MRFDSKVTIDSKTCEGVHFTIRRLSQVLRAKRDAEIIKEQVRYAELAAKYSDVVRPYQAPGNKLETAVASLEYALSELDPESPFRNALKEYWTEFLQQTPRPAPEMPGDVTAQLVAIDREMGLLIASSIKPATIRAALVSISGYEIDGRAATAQTLLENGPDALIDEVWLAINAHSVLSPEQQKNSSSLSDSPAVPESQEEKTPTTANAANV